MGETKKIVIAVVVYDRLGNFIKWCKLAKIMGENGRRAVLEEYNWGTQETTLLSIYNSFTKTL